MRPIADQALSISRGARPERPRACFCSGPRPGHTRCPCRERADAANESRLERENRLLREQVQRLTPRGENAVERLARLRRMIDRSTDGEV